MGYTVARLAGDLKGPAREGCPGFGPLRLWPGGINMARAIGDNYAGEGLLPYPYITHLRVPPKGARFIIATDGVWDAHGVTVDLVCRIMRRKRLNDAAVQILQRSTLPLTDDTTLLLVDVLPESTVCPSHYPPAPPSTPPHRLAPCLQHLSTDSWIPFIVLTSSPPPTLPS